MPGSRTTPTTSYHGWFGPFATLCCVGALLSPHEIVVEWIETNPIARDDAQYAPVGSYMFMSLDRCDKRVD